MDRRVGDKKRSGKEHGVGSGEDGELDPDVVRAAATARKALAAANEALAAVYSRVREEGEDDSESSDDGKSPSSGEGDGDAREEEEEEEQRLLGSELSDWPPSPGTQKPKVPRGSKRVLGRGWRSESLKTLSPVYTLPVQSSHAAQPRRSAPVRVKAVDERSLYEDKVVRRDSREEGGEFVEEIGWERVSRFLRGERSLSVERKRSKSSKAGVGIWRGAFGVPVQDALRGGRKRSRSVDSRRVAVSLSPSATELSMADRVRPSKADVALRDIFLIAATGRRAGGEKDDEIRLSIAGFERLCSRAGVCSGTGDESRALPALALRSVLAEATGAGKVGPIWMWDTTTYRVHRQGRSMLQLRATYAQFLQAIRLLAQRSLTPHLKHLTGTITPSLPLRLSLVRHWLPLATELGIIPSIESCLRTPSTPQPTPPNSPPPSPSYPSPAAKSVGDARRQIDSLLSSIWMPPPKLQPQPRTGPEPASSSPAVEERAVVDDARVETRDNHVEEEEKEVEEPKGGSEAKTRRKERQEVEDEEEGVGGGGGGGGVVVHHMDHPIPSPHPHPHPRPSAFPPPRESLPPPPTPPPPLVASHGRYLIHANGTFVLRAPVADPALRYSPRTASPFTPKSSSKSSKSDHEEEEDGGGEGRSDGKGGGEVASPSSSSSARDGQMGSRSQRTSEGHTNARRSHIVSTRAREASGGNAFVRWRGMRRSRSVGRVREVEKEVSRASRGHSMPLVAAAPEEEFGGYASDGHAQSVPAAIAALHGDRRRRGGKSAMRKGSEVGREKEESAWEGGLEGTARAAARAARNARVAWFGRYGEAFVARKRVEEAIHGDGGGGGSGSGSGGEGRRRGRLSLRRTEEKEGGKVRKRVRSHEARISVPPTASSASPSPPSSPTRASGLAGSSPSAEARASVSTGAPLGATGFAVSGEGLQNVLEVKVTDVMEDIARVELEIEKEERRGEGLASTRTRTRKRKEVDEDGNEKEVVEEVYEEPLEEMVHRHQRPTASSPSPPEYTIPRQLATSLRLGPHPSALTSSPSPTSRSKRKFEDLNYSVAALWPGATQGPTESMVRTATIRLDDIDSDSSIPTEDDGGKRSGREGIVDGKRGTSHSHKPLPAMGEVFAHPSHHSHRSLSAGRSRRGRSRVDTASTPSTCSTSSSKDSPHSGPWVPGGVLGGHSSHTRSVSHGKKSRRREEEEEEEKRVRRQQWVSRGRKRLAERGRRGMRDVARTEPRRHSRHRRQRMQREDAWQELWGEAEREEERKWEESGSGAEEALDNLLKESGLDSYASVLSAPQPGVGMKTLRYLERAAMLDVEHAKSTRPEVPPRPPQSEVKPGVASPAHTEGGGEGEDSSRTVEKWILHASTTQLAPSPPGDSSTSRHALASFHPPAMNQPSSSSSSSSSTLPAIVSDSHFAADRTTSGSSEYEEGMVEGGDAARKESGMDALDVAAATAAAIQADLDDQSDVEVGDDARKEERVSTEESRVGEGGLVEEKEEGGRGEGEEGEDGEGASPSKSLASDVGGSESKSDHQPLTTPRSPHSPSPFATEQTPSPLVHRWMRGRTPSVEGSVTGSGGGRGSGDRDGISPLSGHVSPVSAQHLPPITAASAAKRRRESSRVGVDGTSFDSSEGSSGDGGVGGKGTRAGRRIMDPPPTDGPMRRLSPSSIASESDESGTRGSLHVRFDEESEDDTQRQRHHHLHHHHHSDQDFTKHTKDGGRKEDGGKEDRGDRRKSAPVRAPMPPLTPSSLFGGAGYGSAATVQVAGHGFRVLVGPQGIAIDHGISWSSSLPQPHPSPSSPQRQPHPSSSSSSTFPHSASHLHAPTTTPSSLGHHTHSPSHPSADPAQPDVSSSSSSSSASGPTSSAHVPHAAQPSPSLMLFPVSPGGDGIERLHVVHEEGEESGSGAGSLGVSSASAPPAPSSAPSSTSSAPSSHEQHTHSPFPPFPALHQHTVDVVRTSARDIAMERGDLRATVGRSPSPLRERPMRRLAGAPPPIPPTTREGTQAPIRARPKPPPPPPGPAPLLSARSLLAKSTTSSTHSPSKSQTTRTHTPPRPAATPPTPVSKSRTKGEEEDSRREGRTSPGGIFAPPPPTRG